MKLGRRLLVECVGTGWLVFAGCAGAALNAGIPVQGWNLLGTPVAFGLALLAANFVAARTGKRLATADRQFAIRAVLAAEAQSPWLTLLCEELP